MKIAYLTDNLLGTKGNGVTSQALTWANYLNKAGVQVDLVSPWSGINPKDYDLYHLFGSGGVWFYDTAKALRNLGIPSVWSPICDDIVNPRLQRLKSFVAIPKLQCFSFPYIRTKAYEVFDRISVRSQYEADYLRVAYGADPAKMDLVPLAMSYDFDLPALPKEDFCFHMSMMYQERKNVIRLVEAAKKYNFQLVLAGTTGTAREFAPLKRAIGDAPNIKVVGFVSEEEKWNLYQRAKVFALPSISEGVGIVALDAAHFGCGIVVTEIGGPKEYYGKFGYQVNPYDIDSIGKGVLAAFGNPQQPQVKQFVDANFSPSVITQKLIDSYRKTIDTCSRP